MFILFALLLLPLSSVSAAPEIMTADQVLPGMQGIAKTVIQGTKIDTFDIEIIGVVQESDASEGRILAKASGAVIDKTGGVLQGMSGSPVYIDGKLIGAVSGGWKDIDNRTCLITPIADMLKLWDMPEVSGRKIKQVNLKEVLKSYESKEDSVTVKEESKEKALATPIMAAGLSDGALALLTEKLEPFDMVPYAAASAQGNFAPVTIEPGSSIGAQLVRGDFSLAAIGTVTAVEDGKVLAFGHPFLRKGNVNYFMTDANIIGTASGLNTGFKIGVPGNLVGVIQQDRTSAIAGKLGKYPSVIPLEVRVTDKQLNTTKRYTMQIAYDEQLASTLTATMVYNAIDKTIDRTGEGTAKVSFEILSSALSDGVLKRDNMYYNPQEVGKLAIGEVFQAMDLLCSNNLNEVDIFSVKVNIEIEQARKTASILEVVPDKPVVKPGEKVNLAVKLKPYRSDEVVVVVPYTVPKYQAPGMMALEVRGGGLVPIMQLLMQQQGIMELGMQEEKNKPLDKTIQEFMEANKNNEIIVEQAIVPNEQEMQAETVHPVAVDRSKNVGHEVKDTNKEMKNTKFATEYIIDNFVQTSVNVQSAK
ncbi:SpoIVB peptidase S55 domain-containing protein [Anaerosinus massiliensis]|uniref:SpoIVB peptidase S55 domain-containing protein n=1 Tax=Massilibacillus massiliensis TaxID=1806837 RepID=UPI000B254BDC|nr:SpoIVB peptidase S55 domain-containing protein [Massilibacillus massiliensis]